MVIPRFCFLGYGLLEAWVFINFIGIFANYTQDSESIENALQSDALLGISMFFVAAGCLAIAQVSPRIQRISNHPRFSTVAVLCACIGSVISRAFPFGAALAVNCLLGFLNAWLWLMWSEVFARVDLDEAQQIALFSGVVTAICAVVATALPENALVGISAILPALSYGSFLASIHDLQKRDSPVTATTHQHSDATKSPMRNLVLGIGIPSFLVFLLLETAFTITSLGTRDAIIVLGAVVFVVAFAISLRHLPSLDYVSLFALLGSFVAAIALLAGLKAPSFLTSGLVIGAWLSLDTLSWLLFTRMCHEQSTDIIRPFAIGQTILFSCSALGCMGALAYKALLAHGFMSQSLLCLIVLAVLFFAALFILGIRESREPRFSPHTDTTTKSDPLAQLAICFGLSEREKEVLNLVLQGRSAPFIRDELHISESTVRTHIRHIHEKMGVTTKQETISKAQEFLGNTSS